MKVAVFFGGKSCEHNISIITGVQAMRALKARHEVIPIYIDNSGVFYTGKELSCIDSFKAGSKAKKMQVSLMPTSNCLYSVKGKVLAKIDAALLCTHGTYGEDGCLQGLLSLCGIPFTGSGVLASAVGMDKEFMKKTFEHAKLPVVPYIAFTKGEYKNDLYSIVERIKSELRFPIIVKPAGLGSSIGISIAHDFPELFEALSNGFLWDSKIVIENALVDFTEFNCACLGAMHSDLTVSEIERPISKEEFLTYKEKYLTKQKGSKTGTEKEFPAKIDASLTEQIKNYTRRTFEAIGASGVARVDFLLENGTLYVNEINTIPGALSNYLFNAGAFKINFSDLLDRLLNIAIKEKSERDSLTYIYKSSYEL